MPQATTEKHTVVRQMNHAKRLMKKISRGRDVKMTIEKLKEQISFQAFDKLKQTVLWNPYKYFKEDDHEIPSE